MESLNTALSDNQSKPIRVALMWNSELPPDDYMYRDLEIVKDIFHHWKIAPLDLVDLSSGLNIQTLAETYSTIILPSVELLSPFLPFPLANGTIDVITSAIVNYSINIILANVQPVFDFANPIYEAAFDMKTDGSTFVIGERYEQLFKFHEEPNDWIIARSGHNVVLHESLLSYWWGLCGYDERIELGMNEDFTATDFFNVLGIALPEAIAWILGVPAFTLRNDDIYIESWNFDSGFEGLKNYVEFMGREAGWVEASNGIVGLYDQETNYASAPYQRKLGDYGMLVSHSWTHPFLSTLSLEEQIEELANTKDYLAKMYPDEFDPSLFIVPNNDWNQLTLVALNMTGHSMFTAARFRDVLEYISSPAKKEVFLQYGWYTTEYEGKEYSVYGFPWMYAYDANSSTPQGVEDLSRTPEGWVTEDYARGGFAETRRTLFEFYYPLMIGTHGVYQAWEHWENWEIITRNIIQGLHGGEIPYLRVAETAESIRDVKNLEKVTMESAFYDDSGITLTLTNPGPELRNMVLFANSLEPNYIAHVLVDDSLHIGFGDNYVFIPSFSGSLKVRIQLTSSSSPIPTTPILRGITVGGLEKASFTNSEVEIEISGRANPVYFATTILSLDLSGIDQEESVQRIYVQGEEGTRGIYQIADLRHGWDGWNYNADTRMLRIKARIFGKEQVRILLSGQPSPTINHRPTAMINSPLNGSIFTGNAAITLQGGGADVDGDSLIYFWSSSLDGDLGNSPTLQINGADLSPGNHAIMLIVAENGPHYTFADRTSINIYISSRTIINPIIQNILQIVAIIGLVLVILPLIVRRRAKRPESKRSRKEEIMLEPLTLWKILYQIFLSNGPWLFATAFFLILGMAFMMVLDFPEKKIMSFSLGIATPISLILSGWLVGLSIRTVSDYYIENQIFSSRYSMKRFLMIALTALILIGLAMFAIMQYLDFSLELTLLTFSFFISFGPLWYAVGMLNAFKRYGRMTIIFAGGVCFGYSLAMLFATTGQPTLLVGLAYGAGYLLAAIGIFIYLFTSLLSTPWIQKMSEEEIRYFLALLTEPRRSDTLKTIQEKTSLQPPLTEDAVTLLKDGLKLRLKEGKSELSLRRVYAKNSWLIIGAICYATFIWIDRIFVWFVTGQQTSGYVLAINSIYEIGVNIGFWVLLFTTGMIAFAFRDFSDRYIQATNRLYSDKLDTIESGLSELAGNVFTQLLKIILMAGIIAVILFVNASQILTIFRVGSVVGEADAPYAVPDITHPSMAFTSPSVVVLRIAAIDAVFIAIFLYTHLGLSYLAMYKKAALVLIIALGVATPLVLVIITNFAIYYAVLGHLAGSVVAAGVGIVFLRKELKPETIIHRYVAPQL
ncbi:MAG: exopolysaccharide Pel transporter PelG [Candidatus Heimdallarchaeota archaeon]